jgi:hypothetical protein
VALHLPVTTMTSVWTENYTAPASRGPQVPEPRRSAPPIMQQATASTTAVPQPAQPEDEEVIWDDSMMDLEDETPQVVEQSSATVSQTTTETTRPSNIGSTNSITRAYIL